MKSLLLCTLLTAASAVLAGGACGTAKGTCPFNSKADNRAKAAAGASQKGCAAPATCDTTAKEKNVISTKDLAAKLESKDKPLILDARGEKGFANGRIPGAKNLSARSDDETIRKIAGTDKSAAIVTYCSSIKCPASKLLAAKLRKLGYTNVSEYSEGIAGWTAAGNKVEKAD